MKATIAIYDSHRQAMEALKALEKHFFSLNKVSVIGETQVVEDHIHIDTSRKAEFAPVVIGIIVGPLIGMLSGLGMIPLPGLNPLLGSGALVGALAGLELGVAIGGTISLIITVMKKRENRIVNYEKHLQEKGYLIKVDGTRDEIKLAEQILHEEEEEINAAA
jgi:hypothetical protein